MTRIIIKSGTACLYVQMQSPTAGTTTLASFSKGPLQRQLLINLTNLAAASTMPDELECDLTIEDAQALLETADKFFASPGSLAEILRKALTRRLGLGEPG